jgi:sialate O-acetylesterase
VADAATGEWYVTLNPANPTPPGKFATMTVAGSSDGFARVITVSRVQFGEVFFCSGQSNMVFSVMGSDGAAIASRPLPNLRLFAVTEAGAASPQPDFAPQGNKSCWWVRTPSPSPDNSTYACNTWMDAVPGVTDYFSATCALTALALADAYLGNDTTIGLVYSAFGGTAIRRWSPPEALAACNVSGEGSDLFNAMVAPAVGFSIRSVLWY